MRTIVRIPVSLCGALHGCCAAACALVTLSVFPASAQTQTEMQQVLQRLDRLEEQNRVLVEEIRNLRQELAAGRAAPAPATAAQPSVEERVEVQENRTAELAQSKVEASQHFPVRLTGMVLFNAFLNSHGSGGDGYPTFAVPGGEPSGGGTLRQSIIGLDYTGPRSIGGGRLSGSLRLDLYGGSGDALDQVVRLRTATVALDWKTRGFLAGVDKPIISPREPESLAQVGASPLSGAGNLWLWIPQARFHQDLSLGDETGVRAQVGVVQTHEVSGRPASPYGPGSQSPMYVEPARPGVEARVEFFHGASRRVEIAGGIHHSATHAIGASIPSDVYTLDWLARPWEPLEFTGAFYTGQNVAPLGTGGIRQGFIALDEGRAVPVHGRGGWGQLKWRATQRLWFNLFSGQQDDRDSDLTAYGIGKNLVFGANVFCRIAPNVLASFEASQARTRYLKSGTLLNNHYDFGLAYLF